jgi:predicted dehydrogenase
MTTTLLEPEVESISLPIITAPKKRYAIVGLGARARMFTDAIASKYLDVAELVGLCDISPTRIEWHNNRLHELHGHGPVEGFGADEFEAMIERKQVDIVIVTTMDVLHHEYIVRAMNAGCDVIVEKPMTIDAEKAAIIHETMQRTGRNLSVTFNVRYQPLSTKVRELIASGVIGKPLSVNLNYSLDTKHGADYFRRWHRDKANSGGLLVHKATHHFDLVNWLIDSVPEEVFAFGDLKFYGKEAAEGRGENYDYERYTGSEASKNDPFAMRLDESDYTRTLYLNAEGEGGYVRDKNVFGSGITIEDTMGVLVKYRNGAIMNYSLIAYAPQEAYELYITGDKGRIEVRYYRTPHTLDENFQIKNEMVDEYTVRVFPMFREAYDVEIPKAEGGHGGGDVLMLEHLLSGKEIDDPMHRHATYEDGLASLGLGIAANQSIITGKPVHVQNVVAIG